MAAWAAFISLKCCKVVDLEFDEHEYGFAQFFENGLISSVEKLIASHGEIDDKVDHEKVGVREFVSVENFRASPLFVNRFSHSVQSRVEVIHRLQDYNLLIQHNSP